MRKAIAIDFDGCLCTDAFPSIGEPNWPVIYRAKAEQQAGAGLILWTCREGQILQDAVAACESWGLTFDAVNESLPDWIKAFGNRPRKVGASEYWDDKAARIPVAQRFFVGGPGDGSIELFEPNFGHKNMELNPCPFCGSTRIFYERYRSPAGERWRCWCTECLAGIDPGTAQAAGLEREKVLAAKLDQAIHDLHFVMADGDACTVCKNKCLMGTADACQPRWKGLDD